MTGGRKPELTDPSSSQWRLSWLTNGLWKTAQKTYGLIRPPTQLEKEEKLLDPPSPIKITIKPEDEFDFEEAETPPNSLTKKS